jgi:hypothetical protein
MRFFGIVDTLEFRILNTFGGGDHEFKAYCR